MNKIELEVVTLSQSVNHSQNYTVILSEVNGLRRLPIVIGGFEAQAIAVALERISPARPLTHDLIRNLFHSLGGELKEVLISGLIEGIFYARLVCSKSNGQYVEIDSRTSDAIALAIRFGCPIYVEESILEQAGIVFEEDIPEEKKKKSASSGKAKTGFAQYSDEELYNLLDEVLEKEEYERAAQIRDELKKRGLA